MIFIFEKFVFDFLLIIFFPVVLDFLCFFCI
jgi:hypothetical protein